MAGSPYTNFNSTAFSVGAAGGAFMIASALAQGIAAFQAQQADAFARWDLEQAIAALRLSELFRLRELRTLQRVVNELAAEHAENERLRRDLAIAKVRARRQ